MADDNDYYNDGGNFDDNQDHLDQEMDMQINDDLDTENEAPKLDLLPGTTIRPQAIEKDKRITTRHMTKYERARVLGTRALQISMNAPVMVDIAGETDPLKIAMKELRERKIPMIIRRYLPDNSYEDW
eukprot:CAMPEP_0196762246 /NCGR_PEP_ID=MMETSP1095-20130614/1653_1 /TAXON_ID=96789 ORGANISM="Chromulina nebulosa, Strain UTEXLB2642" /NCGR_SAMPLE_ID=MMETSP1095 /ASSEMBLY_ACC=CAM_ASM_000446 /LENGTH=127 /DNA_ID=CAMNT_0042112797 /DNA_START=14 /DNA_END=394 /DNA_ORIENTATION=+